MEVFSLNIWTAIRTEATTEWAACSWKVPQPLDIFLTLWPTTQSYPIHNKKRRLAMYNMLYQLVMGAYQSSKLFEGDGLGWLAHPKKKSLETLHSSTIKVFKLCILPSRVFLKGFWDVSKIGDNPKNNLAKFGYTPDMKAFFWKNRMLLYYWLPGGTYHTNLVILVLFCCFSKSGEFGPFSPWNHIFQVKHMEKIGL